MPNQEQIDRNYLRIAIINGYNMSKDPARKVGSVLVSKDNRQVSLGYNGFPKGVEETTEKWLRPKKYEYVLHGEVNAIINCPFDASGGTIYTPFRPCHRCLGQIINAGIIRIVYFSDYDNNIPFIGQDNEVYDDLVKLIQEDTYLIDNLTQKLIDIYEYKHDGYQK